MVDETKINAIEDNETPRGQAAGSLQTVTVGLKYGLYQGIQAAIHGTDAEP